MKKIEALAEYLEVDINTLTETYENTYKTENGEEYLVLTDDEANEMFYDDIESFCMECGLEGFSFLKDIIMDYYINEDYFENSIGNSESDDIYDMLEEEIFYEAECYDIDTEDCFAEEIIPQIYNIRMAQHRENGFANTYASWYGIHAISELIQHNPQEILLFDELVEYLKDTYGRGQHIASYDGEEIELDNNLYAYRID